MKPSIPANLFTNVIPSVLQAGGADLAMNGVFLDTDPSIPIGTLQGFPNAEAVGNWFGFDSAEYAAALDYFAGYNGATSLPSIVYWAQYNQSAVAAYLRGGALTGVSLTEIQALTGVLTMAIDGRTVTSASINLSSATSFSNAAQLIEAGLQNAGSIFNGTGTVTNGSPILTINSTVSGELHVGDTVVGTDIPANTTILSFGSYTPGAGTGTVNLSANATGAAGPETVTVTSAATASYDSLRNAFVITSPTTGVNSSVAYPTTDAFATGLLLTAAAGAVLSQGAAAATPAALMTALTEQSTDWATFTHVADPDNGAAGGPIKVEFATWNAGQNGQFLYVPFDSDVTPSESADDGSCFGQAVADLEGTFPIWDLTQGAGIAAFICGLVASINWNQPGGRTTLAYRSSPVLTPDVVSPTVYENVKANGYNAYVDVATRTTQFQWMQPGSVTGDWDWADSYINQIYWNARFQNDFASLLSQVPAIPYNQAGYNMIRQALMPDIVAMGEFGAWVAGVQLSGSQQVAVNTAAGASIAGTLQTQGWYLQITDPGASARAARQSPNVTFWYCDGGSVQQINMASIDVE